MPLDLTGARLGGVLLAAALLLPGAAAAQALDPTGRYDLDEALRRHPHDPDQLPSAEEAGRRPIRIELSLAGTYSGNPGPTRRDRSPAGYATPGLSLDLGPIDLAGWGVGGGAGIEGDYYAGADDDRFGEGRLEGFVFASHALGPGTLTGEVVVHSVFDNDFGQQHFRLLIGALDYTVRRGPITLDLDAEYEDADTPELRRTRLASTLAYAPSQPLLGHRMTFEGGLAFSDFNGGANASRNDVVAALALIAARPLGRGWSVEWEAALVRRFSNRDASRFHTFDLGVELTRRF